MVFSGRALRCVALAAELHNATETGGVLEPEIDRWLAWTITVLVLGLPWATGLGHTGTHL
jgi:hypothetical protein